MRTFRASTLVASVALAWLGDTVPFYGRRAYR
jgi:hypothetical protein